MSQWIKFSLPSSRGNLYYSALAANIAAAAAGTHYSWTSPTLPKLKAVDSWLPVSDEQASWISSLTALGTVFGPFLGGWLVNLIGRRWSMLVSVVTCLIGWVVLLISTSVWHIYLGKFIGGVGGGIVFTACPTYVAEISEPSVRGGLGSLFGFFFVGGFMIEYGFGPYVSYSVLIFLNLIPCLLFFLLFITIPESPYYFLLKNKTSSAEKSLSWLRTGRSIENIQQEIKEIQMEVSKTKSEKAKLSDLVATKGSRLGLLISISLAGGQQLSGINVVQSNAQDIFIKAGTPFSSSISALIVGAILFIGNGVASPFVNTFGMRNILIGSALGMCVFQFALAVYFYFSKLGDDMNFFSWLPVTSLVGYTLSFTVGFGPLPWAVMAELFPSKVKGLASAITASFCWLVAFVMTKFFNNISELLGIYFAFLLFSIFCFASLLFTVFVLPDTRGLTLQEISDLLNK